MNSKKFAEPTTLKGIQDAKAAKELALLKAKQMAKKALQDREERLLVHAPSGNWWDHVPKPSAITLAVSELSSVGKPLSRLCVVSSNKKPEVKDISFAKLADPVAVPYRRNGGPGIMHVRDGKVIHIEEPSKPENVQEGKKAMVGSMSKRRARSVPKNRGTKVPLV